jgi:cytochrome c
MRYSPSVYNSPREINSCAAVLRKSLWRAAVTAAGLLLPLSGSGLAQADGNAANGKQIFQRCASCHVVTGSDASRKGPSLQKIVGRPVASVAGYAYSPNMVALGASGAKWDAKTLDQFLTDPSEFVKGTKMTAPPVRRETERADLIAYLATL